MLRPCDSRVVSWVHMLGVMVGETDPAKQHLLPLNERADRLAERGRSGDPCFVLQRWVYTIGVDEPELSVERCRWCRRIFSTLGAASIHEARCRLKVGSRLLNVGNAACGSLGILVGPNAWLMSNTVWVQRSQT